MSTRALTTDRDDLDEVLVRTRSQLSGQRSYAMLYGPPGTGKTTSAIESAAPDQAIFHYTLRAEASAIELTGHKEIQDGNTVFWEGLGLQAWRKGGLLVLNELNNASEDVLNFLYQLLDDPKIAEMHLPSGEIVKPAPGFRVIATMNGLPSELPDAIRDRFGMWLSYDEPSSRMYELLDEDVREVVRAEYERAADARSARDKNPLISFREAMTFCDLRRSGVFASELECATIALSRDHRSGAQWFVTQLEAVGRSAEAGPQRSTLLPDGI